MLKTIFIAVKYVKTCEIVQFGEKFSYKSKVRIRNENLGWGLENLVYIELLRRTRPLFQDVYFYRKGYEIDFVICESNKVLELIQVSVDVSSPKTYKREVSALLKGSSELHCDKLTLITNNDSRRVTEDGCDINIVSIVDWLL